MFCVKARAKFVQNIRNEFKPTKHLQLTGMQARRQHSVTGGAGINFGGHEKFIYVNSRGARGAREIYPSLDQMNKVKTKNS